MPRYAAFLRGINVGGHRVRMQALAEIFRDLGFREVETFIASGNVVFTTEFPDPHRVRVELEDGLARHLGYAVAVFLRTAEELREVATVEPVPLADPSESGPNLHVIFLHQPANPELRRRLGQMETVGDRFAFGAREVFWTTRGRMSDSPVFKGGLERAVAGLPTTVRSLSTVRGLLARMEKER